MSTKLSRVRTAGLTVVAVAVGVLVCGGVASAAGNGRVALAGSVPAWAKSSALKGAATGSSPVGFRVYLGWRNENAVKALARAVSSPSSRSYGHYLTPQQFRQRFAPSQSDVNAVESWLRSQGFRVDYVPHNNHYVAAEGTVAQADAAFGVTLKEYRYQGMTLRSPASALTIPSSLAGVVQSVAGLDESAALVRPDVSPSAPPAFGFRNAGPFSTFWADNLGTFLGETYPWAPRGYTPPMLRGAYGIADSVAAGLDGSGQTVAIIDAYASPTIFQDAQTYSQLNDPGHVLTHSQFHQIVAPGIFNRPENKKQDPQGWYGEETLDVEAVHGMAPGANILFVGAPNNYRDLDAALNHVVDQHLANIVTNSYGFIGDATLPPGYVKSVEQTIEQGVIEGIGIYYSTGDFGDNSLLFGLAPTANWPASSPFVTAVGGTSLGVGAGDTYVGETGWSTARVRLEYSNGVPDHWGSEVFTGGGGGGPSHLFAAPWYQAGVNTDGGMRTVPDISMDGDPNTGMLEGQTQYFPDGSCPGGGTVCYGEYRIGGTSVSSPLLAGVMALVNQQRANNGLPPLGFANPAIYAAYAENNGSLHDVKGTTIGGYDWVFRNDFFNTLNTDDTDPLIAPTGIITSKRTLGYTGQFIQTGTGYDDMTGVGTPDGSTFLDTLAAFTG